MAKKDVEMEEGKEPPKKVRKRPPRPGEGRPLKLTAEVKQAILLAVANGSSVSQLCQQEDMPSMSTVWRHMAEDKEFQDQYEKACKKRSNSMFEDIQRITDDPTIPSDHKRIMVDTRKWMLARMDPAKYSEKVRAQITGADDGPVQVEAKLTGVTSILDALAERKADEE